MTHPANNKGQLSPLEIQKMLHELQTHQIQLEMQNEELRRIQEDLDITRARYFDLYNLAPVGYFTLSAKGLIVEVNRTALILLGVHREALVGTPFSRFVFQEDHEVYALHCRQHRSSDAPQACELRMVKRDGAMIWVHLATSAIADLSGESEYRVAIIDITTRKRTEEALCERETQYRRIMETAREGIGITDGNWRLTLVNHCMAELLGYSPGEMVGQSLENFVFAEDLALYAQRKAERQGGRNGYHESRFRGKKGGEVWAMVSATAQMDGVGTFSGSFFMLTDITKRKVAEASSKAKSDFLALVSHEIRTPLNALVGFSALARKTGNMATLREYLDIIDQSSRSLMDLVNNILDMSKIEARQLSLESIPFNLADAIDLLVWQYAPLATQKNLDFQVSKDPGLPLWVSGDPLRLRQILANLITNAIKFTESGSVSLTLTTTEARQDDARLWVRFAVRDTGIGIAEENFASLFRPFLQLDPSSTRKYGGTGLGLAIVQSLVTLMTGRTEVASEEGGGSCFVVELPFRIGTPPNHKKIAAQVVVPLNILVVEDNAFNRQYLSELLTRWGHTATQAENAYQALALTEQHEYHRIILDIRMPGMDGIELAGRLRQREKERQSTPVPIIACTGDTEGITKERCLAAGMQAVLFKPINPDKLAMLVNGQGDATAAPLPSSAADGRTANPIIVDMGLHSDRIDEYLQLLRDDIHSELQRIDQALSTKDREVLRDAAHTLKGLCGHLREKLPKTLALRLHEEAFTASQEDLRSMAIRLRSTCVPLFTEN